MILVAAPVNDAKVNVKFVTDANLFRMFPLVNEITAISLEGRTKTGKIVNFFSIFFLSPSQKGHFLLAMWRD